MSYVQVDPYVGRVGDVQVDPCVSSKECGQRARGQTPYICRGAQVGGPMLIVGNAPVVKLPTSACDWRCASGSRRWPRAMRKWIPPLRFVSG
jgi:hypothetical protein